ncbi:MAG: sulfite exporter TauE/SafE family protein [Gammaproteobacteria bacterium]|nr:sulfite exporter TauE/SafE family protein [Gammaproteobacteria bacterium]
MAEINLLSAFVVGLLGGVHCVGMCGGIVGAVSLGLPAQRQLPLLFAYNVGRITSYTVAGAIMGALGFYFSGLLPVQNAQRMLLGLAGVFMVLLGLYLGGWWNLLTRVERAGGIVWRRIEPLGRGLLPVRSLRQALLLGLVWGWLPCGLVYSALVWTVASGGAWQGAGLMLAFGLGTLPNLLLMGVAAATLQRWVRRPATRAVAGGLVMLFGVWQLYRAVSG